MNKRIKLFEEFRAMGFQYSEPKDKFQIRFSLDDDESEAPLENTIEDILKKYDIKHDDVDVDGWDIEINVRVYKDEEIDSIMNSLLTSLVKNKIYPDRDSIEVEPM